LAVGKVIPIKKQIVVYQSNHCW